MPKDEIEQEATLSRQEVARWLADLARAIDEGGTVEVGLAGPPVTLELGDEFECELEIEPHSDEIELEIELKWSRSRTKQDGPTARTVTARDR